jgi:hypothetical protein
VSGQRHFMPYATGWLWSAPWFSSSVFCCTSSLMKKPHHHHPQPLLVISQKLSFCLIGPGTILFGCILWVAKSAVISAEVLLILYYCLTLLYSLFCYFASAWWHALHACFSFVNLFTVSFHLVLITCGKKRFKPVASYLILSWYSSSKCLFWENPMSPWEHYKHNCRTWSDKSDTFRLFKVEGRSRRSVKLATFHSDSQTIPVQRKYTAASCRSKSNNPSSRILFWFLGFWYCRFQWINVYTIQDYE